MKRLHKILFAIAWLAALVPLEMAACPACGSGNPETVKSPLTDGMNLGILTLLGVLVPVLGCFGFCLVRMINRDGTNPNPDAAKNITDV